MKKFGAILFFGFILAACQQPEVADSSADVAADSKNTRICETPIMSLHIKEIKASADELDIAGFDSKSVVMDALKNSYCFVIDGEKLARHADATLLYTITKRVSTEQKAFLNLNEETKASLSAKVDATLIEGDTTRNYSATNTINANTQKILGLGEELPLDASMKRETITAAVNQIIKNIVKK